MRAADIVSLLQRRLPLFTSEFTTSHVVTSATHVGTLAALTTATNHGLAPGDQIHIRGARTPIAILSITHAANATVATVTTQTDHDLTLYSTWAEGNIAEIEGANEADFNGSRKLVAVHNRRTFDVEVAAGAPAAATGAPRLMNGSNVYRTLGGLYSVTSVPGANQLIVTHDRASDLGTLAGTITIRTAPRLTAAVNPRAAGLAYSKQYGGNAPKPWGYVILRDVTASRGRQAQVDAIDVNVRSGAWHQIVVQPFTVLVAFPMADEALGRNARDRAEDLLRPLCLALLGQNFPTGLARSRPSAPVQFVGHAGQEAEPGPVYLHGYDFEQVAVLGIEDTSSDSDTVAFRDIDLSMGFNVGTGAATAAIDLDEDPL